uniref:Dirigent protein n=1 Tax=Leersia perrieri TaxID=77586 RepID=A0A0D9XPN6_9ORYZ
MAKRLAVVSVLLVLAAISKADTQSGPGPGPSTSGHGSVPTHLHFYFHDKITGTSPSAVQVVKPPNNKSPTSFGTVYVMDDPLTEGTDPKSKPVGRAQGMYLSSDQARIGFLQAMNIVLTAGPYNGSVITVLGSNHISDNIREMPIVGGTGTFRFGHGYAQAHTYFLDPNGLDAIVEYNIKMAKRLALMLAVYLVPGITGESHKQGMPEPSHSVGYGSVPTHLHFYFHDKLSGPSPSAVRVVSPPNNTSRTFFGMAVVIDDPLTEGPDPGSKLIGRAQGMYVSSDQAQIGFLMAMNIMLTDWPYNGSVITVLGSNHVLDDVREMPIVGGTGTFRFARGYVQAHTYFVDFNTGDAIVEYNIKMAKWLALMLVVFLVLGITGEAHTHGGPGPSPSGQGFVPIHLHFYFHEKVSGPLPSAVMVVNPPNNMSRTLFGMVVVLDDALTEGPDLGSKLVGRAQGMYFSSNQVQIGLLMAMNIILTDGPYNGSMITVLGSNHILDDVREMPIVGGTGAFRFARGYVQAHTYFVDFNTQDATVDYNAHATPTLPHALSSPHPPLHTKQNAPLPAPQPCRCSRLPPPAAGTSDPLPRGSVAILSPPPRSVLPLLNDAPALAAGRRPRRRRAIQSLLARRFPFLPRAGLRTTSLPFRRPTGSTDASTMEAKGVVVITLVVSLLVAVASAAHPEGGPVSARIGSSSVPTHLHFYFHDKVSKPSPSAVRVVDPVDPRSFFGMVNVMDDSLTEGPEPKSKPVGRAQGMYMGSDQAKLGFLQAMNLVFTDGPYNGSVISVLGRNCPLDDVREMPVIGGTGAFRFARGYAQAHTHTLDLKTGDAIVEYNVYVMH